MPRRRRHTARKGARKRRENRRRDDIMIRNRKIEADVHWRNHEVPRTTPRSRYGAEPSRTRASKERACPMPGRTGSVAEILRRSAEARREPLSGEESAKKRRSRQWQAYARTEQEKQIPAELLAHHGSAEWPRKSATSVGASGRRGEDERRASWCGWHIGSAHRQRRGPASKPARDTPRMPPPTSRVSAPEKALHSASRAIDLAGRRSRFFRAAAPSRRTYALRPACR